METMKLRAIQLPGNAGERLDSLIRVEGRLRHLGACPQRQLAAV